MSVFKQDVRKNQNLEQSLADLLISPFSDPIFQKRERDQEREVKRERSRERDQEREVKREKEPVERWGSQDGDRVLGHA